MEMKSYDHTIWELGVMGQNSRHLQSRHIFEMALLQRRVSLKWTECGVAFVEG